MTDTDVAPNEPSRLVGLDRIRGAAIALMILDHLCVFALEHAALSSGIEQTLILVRGTVTRAAMPMFMIVTGVLLSHRTPSVRRRATIFGVAVCVNIAIAVFNPGLGLPEILLTWSIVMIFAGPIRRWPLWALIIGVLQSITWEQPFAGYPVGAICALIAAGVLAQRADININAAGEKLPGWFAPVGRHPLTWYTAHIGVLCAGGWYIIITNT